MAGIVEDIKALLDAGKYTEALEHFIAYRTDDIPIASEILQELQTLCSTWLENQPIAELFILKGILSYDTKLYDEAIEHLNQAISLSPDLASAFNCRGISYYGLKEFDKAILDYNKTIALDPKYVLAYNNRGNAYHDLKEYDKAILDYNKAIELNPKHVFAYNNRGTTYVDLKEYDKAILDYNKAIALDPEFVIAYNNRGTTYDKLKEFDKAILDYNKAIELNSKYVDTYYNRGDTYHNTKEFDKAIQDFTYYAQHTTSEYWKNQALEKIEEIKEERDELEIRNVEAAINSIKDTLRFEEECITHYTNVSGAQALLLDFESSFRLSEANYMNDTSEGTELRSILLEDIQLHTKPQEPFVAKPFLGSFVADDKDNNLTLWRMYAKTQSKDGHGCAITIDRQQLLRTIRTTFIETDQTTETNRSLDDEFNFYRVAYLSDKTCIGNGSSSETVNKAIASLTEALQNIQEKNNDEALQIALNRISEIEFLFKGAEYQHEDEVRLVLSKTGKDKHIKVDQSEHFEIPRVYLEIGNILPALHSVTIGPKVERPNEWAAAFNYSFEKAGLKDVKISISKLPYK